MHVQADGSSQIQHYADNTSDVQFMIVGYWSVGAYVETWNTFSAGGGGGWNAIDLDGYGVGSGQVAEIVIAFILMSVVLFFTNGKRLERYTGLVAVSVIAGFILVEAPLSGPSFNPARSSGPAVIARAWSDLWIYLIAPVAGMLLAGEVHLRFRGSGGTICAKLDHHNDKRCIFRHCGYR